MPERETVLVTGGAGFIGSNLVDRLCADGHRVVVVDNLSTGRQVNLEPALADHDVELVVDDITDARAMGRLFDSVRPRRVFHLAAQIDVRVSVSDPGFDAGINIVGTINLLEQARRTGVDAFVFASTGGAIYGEGADRKLPLDETAERRPDAPYGQSKLAAEGYLDYYRRGIGLDATALRLGNVYGPRQDPLGEAGVIAIFCGKLLAGEQPTVFGTGEQTRDYIHVSDVVAAFAAAAERRPGGALNVGTGREASVLDLIDVLAPNADGPFEPQFAPPRAGEVERISIDPGRARKALDWRATVELEDGLTQTLAWARAAS